jgi:hypothetical protein
MSDYPVDVTVAKDEGQNLLWGIPFVGLIARVILVIPHAILLVLLGFALYVMLFVSWIPILVNGRMAGLGYTIAGGYLRLSTRTSLYILLITGRYPPFGLSGDHSVAVVSEIQNRLWGIPLIGIFVRGILLIPHVVVLALLGIVVWCVSLLSWLPVLVNGRQADSVVSLVGGYYGWLARVSAYGFLLTGRYPPFRLGD